MSIEQNGTTRDIELGTFASARFHDRSFPEADKNINVPVDWAHRKVRQSFLPGSGTMGSMVGANVNHDTIPWFVYKDVLNELK